MDLRKGRLCSLYFVIRVGNASSYLGVAQLVNADNDVAGPEAIWRFAPSVSVGLRRCPASGCKL